MKTLEDLVNEGGKMAVNGKRYIVHLKNSQPRALYTYNHVVVSSSGMYCNAGTQCWAPPGADWIPTSQIEIVEELV